MVSQRGRGRPIEMPLPEHVPDTPENILNGVLGMPPKRLWRYQQNGQRR